MFVCRYCNTIIMHHASEGQASICVSSVYGFGYVILAKTSQSLPGSLSRRVSGAHQISGCSLLVLVPYTKCLPSYSPHDTINDGTNNKTKGYKLTQVNKERNAQP